jgi:hypothetical protein
VGIEWGIISSFEIPTKNSVKGATMNSLPANKTGGAKQVMIV